jgi:inner membrane protein
VSPVRSKWIESFAAYLLMPTIFSHPAVPLAIAFGLGREIVSRRLLLTGAAASILPDLDVAAFSFGIPYEHEFGHRGFSHSLFFATLVALLGASAGMLEAFTNGGLGIAFFWPWSDARYFLRYQVIEVSPH